MREITGEMRGCPAEETPGEVLEEILKRGAQVLLQKAIENEIEAGFTSRIPSIDNLVPALYQKGISTGDFPAALEAILGERAPGLSATTVVRFGFLGGPA